MAKPPCYIEVCDARAFGEKRVCLFIRGNFANESAAVKALIKEAEAEGISPDKINPRHAWFRRWSTEEATKRGFEDGFEECQPGEHGAFPVTAVIG